MQFTGGMYSQVIVDSGVRLTNVNEEELRMNFAGPMSESHSIYFAASDEYLGDRLSSYGGFLRYSIRHITTGLSTSEKTTPPDLVLKGGNTSLIYYSTSLPSNGEYVDTEIRLTEMHFRQPSGSPATREQYLLLLHNLEAIYIKASPRTNTVEAGLRKFSMDSATDEYFEGDMVASSIEACDCPPSYQGLSCEKCASGHYRTQTGPYGGYCVPCQCNGHTNECDPVSGKCLVQQNISFK
jgi:laminin alpha 3/5